MTAVDTSTGEQRPAAAPRADVAPGAMTIRITTAGVSDSEVAAITVALLAATGAGTAGAGAVGPPAWRYAGVLEAATDRRVRIPAELRHTV